MGLPLLAMAWSSTALAQPDQQMLDMIGGDDAWDDQEIIVTGEVDGYVAIDSTSLKTPTPLIDTPQTVSIITREQMDDQAIQDIGDILRYTPGTSIGQGEGNRDQITIRGQNTTADFFVDGIRDDVQYFRPLYNIERVEILKGANALLFGRGGGGGVINRVTKTPVAETQFVNVHASVDSFGAHNLDADANIPIGERAAIRLNAAYDGFNNHRDVFDGHRFAVNPTIGAEFGDTRLLASYEYVDDDRVTDRGIPTFSDAPIPGARDRFFGIRGTNVTTLKAHIATLRLEHDFSDTLTFKSTTLYGDYDKLYRNVYPEAANLTAGTVTLDGYTDPTARENFITQGNLVWSGKTGPLEHVLLIGYEVGRQKSANQRSDILFAVSNDDLITVPITSDFDALAHSFPTVNRDSSTRLDFFSLYVQDQITVTDWLQLVGGVRYDDLDLDVIDRIANVTLNRKDRKWSPRGGVVVKPLESLSLYGSYARSFLPRAGDQFLNLSPTAANLAPESFENWELGIKWDIRPSLNLTAAIFRLDRDNQAVSVDSQGNSQFAGSRTEGLEIQLVGAITSDWHLNIGYSYLDAKESGVLAGGAFANRRLAQVPKHMASFWSRYDLNDKWGLGLGVTHQSSQSAQITSKVRVPGYTRVDAAVYYTINKQVQVQLNVENLFDETYFPAAHNANNISTGEPINARLSVKFGF